MNASLPAVLAVSAAVVCGAAAGAVLPRAAYRLSVEPEEPWRTACPAGHPFGRGLRGLLGPGRCRACPAGYAAYGPNPAAVSATTALLCAAVALVVGARPELAAWLLLVPLGVLMALVDGAVHRLPDVLTLPAAAGTVALLGVAALLPGAAPGTSWTRALLGAAALTAFYFVLFVVNPAGMGFGDVKLAAVVGAALGWYGWPVLLAGAFAGLLLGAVYGVGLVLLRRADRRTAVPFGPFMLAGALIGVCLGASAA